MSESDPMSNFHKTRAVIAAGSGFSSGESALSKLWSWAPERLLHTYDQCLQHGSIIVHFPGGQTRVLGNHATGPQAEVYLKSWRPIRRLIAGGSTAWARAYIEGDWESPDLTKMFELFSMNRRTLGDSTRGAWWSRLANQAMHSFRANTKLGSQTNISFHYDLGNDFYKQWLDPSMTYSSAIFAEGDNCLETAQRRKYRRLLDLLDAKPGQHILEIGCGWGGFAEFAAQENGVKVHGITLSEEQLSWARQRIAEKGLGDLVTFELIDYRDVKGRYDHIASIEMFEAVGERFWRTFMDKVQSLLHPGGRAALQIITIDEAIFEAYRRGADFIQTYIFPGGMLPSIERFQAVVEDAGLAWKSGHSFSKDYAKTLGYWREAFEGAIQKNTLPQEFNAQFQRIWRYYLAYCEGGFLGGGLDVHHIALQKHA